MRGVTILNSKMVETVEISTHTPHARCDDAHQNGFCHPLDFYSHTSCEVWRSKTLFQSLLRYFYSHTSCEVWRRDDRPRPRYQHFYSHTSCEVWPISVNFQFIHQSFLLTHLMRGVTKTQQKSRLSCTISTHTPHARCDKRRFYYKCSAYIYFYSHTSCEVWLDSKSPNFTALDFYSHTSCEVWHIGVQLFSAIISFLLTHLMRGVTTRMLTIGQSG